MLLQQQPPKYHLRFKIRGFENMLNLQHTIQLVVHLVHACALTQVRLTTRHMVCCTMLIHSSGIVGLL